MTLHIFDCNSRLEEIGAAAAKEYSLEKALEKMKFEWQDVVFEMIPYRETVSTMFSASVLLRTLWPYEGEYCTIIYR